MKNSFIQCHTDIFINFIFFKTDNLLIPCLNTSNTPEYSFALGKRIEPFRTVLKPGTARNLLKYVSRDICRV